MQNDQAAELARRILMLRARRVEHLPAGFFGEAAWTILLVLFIADAKGERVAVDEACRRAGGPFSVAKRWLAALEEQSLIACRTARDGVVVVSLTPQGIHGVEACMVDTQDNEVGLALR